MRFTKMHGLGNDYVYIDCFKEKIPESEEELKELIIRLSDRHFGIGGDGVIFIDKGRLAPFEMRMYNADGSYSPMCGNGIRCVAKYIYDNGLCRDKTFNIESGNAVKIITVFTDEDERSVQSVRVNMGPAILTPAQIPVLPSSKDEDSPIINEPVTVLDREYKMTCVSMGNPHAVCFVDEMISDEDIKRYGPAFEHHERFPQKTNVEFVKVINEHEVSMRVWERGTGETLACGTGTCAVTVASILNGYCVSPVKVNVPGGAVTDEWDRTKNEVFMTGPATKVYDGTIEI